MSKRSITSIIMNEEDSIQQAEKMMVYYFVYYNIGSS